MLRIWELGSDLHPVDRALLVLPAAFPDTTVEELVSLTVGQRDAHLLSIYKENFGSSLSALTDCPECGETLEFSFDVTNVSLPAATQAANHVFQLETDGYSVQFQLPGSRHLAAVANLVQSVVDGDLSAARLHLLEQCVLQIDSVEACLSVADLPETVSAAVVAAMADADPQADVQIHVACSACGHEWNVPFDIVPFLWTRLAERARILLHEIHLLATAYHWSEADILALSPARRRTYLELVTR